MKPSEAITIRLASVDESHIVAELVGRLIDELTDGSGDAARDGELAAAARGLLAEGRFEAFLAFDGGDGAVGLLTLSECGAPDLPRWQRTVDFYKRCGFTEVGPRLKLPLT